MKSIADIIAEKVKEWSYIDLSDSAIEAAKRSTLDTVGCMIAGKKSESTKILKSALSNRGSNPGNLALLNSAAAHSIEMDDFHNQGTVHPGAVIVPATLIVARHQENGSQVNGKNLLEAICAGYEVMIKIGKSSRGSFYTRGFHPTSICGVFGSTAAVGKLLAVESEVLATALGIAGCYASGLLEYKSEGSWTKRLQVGLSSRAGVEAIKLATKGFTGSRSIFEGDWGFLKAYLAKSNTQELKRDWDFKNIAQISYKPYACCRYTHAPIDALLSIIQEDHIKPESIEKINVYTHRQAIASTLKPKKKKYHPETEVDAQFSLPYCLAIAATYGDVYPKRFSSEHRRKPEILSLTKKVNCFRDKEIDRRYPDQNGAKVKVITKEGTFKKTVEDAKGDPGNPLTKEELISKFHTLTKYKMRNHKGRKVSDRIINLDGEKSVSFLTKFLN